MKTMSFFYIRPAVDMNIDTKPPYTDIKFITDDGEDLTMEQKKEILAINMVEMALTLMGYLYSLNNERTRV